jgi:extradiol dioxygenase family protein
MSSESSGERRSRVLARQLCGGASSGGASALATCQPFHLALPVHDLAAAKAFYGGVLGCVPGRERAEHWIDYSLLGHQLVCHYVGDQYRAVGFVNPVDGDEVPVPHAGVVLHEAQFHELAARLKEAGVQFVVEPHLRFEGFPGEQWTMFFRDPSGNGESRRMRCWCLPLLRPPKLTLRPQQRSSSRR